jgi:hypothetical protein
MLIANETRVEVLKRWLPDYQARAATVAGSLGELFQAAMDLGEFDKTESVLHITKPREFLKEQRDKVPYRVLYFIYSSQFDKAIEAHVVDSVEKKAMLSQELTPEEILVRKASLLVRAFKSLAHDADVQADHYTVCLSAHEALREFPLVWDVPAEDESKTGFSPDLMWQMTFRFLCEIAHAIVAYGGFSSSFFDELGYIRNEPYLSNRTLWMDQDFRLYFPDHDETTWDLPEIATVLGKIG